MEHRLAAAAMALAVVPFWVQPRPALAADVVAVVPFAVPGSEKNQVLEDATGILAARLTDRGISPKVLPATDRLSVVATAPAICAQTGATAILVPTARTEQNVRRRELVLYTDTYYATHAELRLSRLRCDGTVAWTTVTVGDKEYRATNVQAAVSDSLNQAIGRALDAYAARAPEAASAVPPVSTAPAAPLGKKIAIVPFTQAGSAADPSLDFATEEARKRFAARGADVVVTDPADHLTATKEAPALCARYGAASLVMGTLRTEQTIRFAGIPTHVEVVLTTVDCTGKVVTTQSAIGEHLHRGSNYRAGISSAIEDAFGHWAETQPRS
jgi:hypothetical protein